MFRYVSTIVLRMIYDLEMIKSLETKTFYVRDNLWSHDQLHAVNECSEEKKAVAPSSEYNKISFKSNI